MKYVEMTATCTTQYSTTVAVPDDWSTDAVYEHFRTVGMSGEFDAEDDFAWETACEVDVDDHRENVTDVLGCEDKILPFYGYSHVEAIDAGDEIIIRSGCVCIPMTKERFERVVGPVESLNSPDGCDKRAQMATMFVRGEI